MRRAVRALVVIALVGSPACGEAEEKLTHPTRVGEIVMKMTTFGGLPPPPDVLERILPSFVLYGDGSVIVAGGDGILPTMQIGRVNERGIQTILYAARDAGLTQGDRQLQVGDLFDASTTHIVVVADEAEHRTDVYGLGYPVPRNDETAPIEEFVDNLHDLAEFVGADAIVQDFKPYESPAVAIAAIEALPRPEEHVVRWDFADLGDLTGRMDVYRTQWRCDVFVSEAPDIIEALGDVEGDARWRSRGRLFTLFARPILLDELDLRGCDPWQTQGS